MIDIDYTWAIGMGSQTLVGIVRPKDEDDWPISTGNCFSLNCDNGKSYRILNFHAENFEECRNRGLEYPIKVLIVRKPNKERGLNGLGLIHDPRISDKWYNTEYCSVCSPFECWPIHQNLSWQRRIDRSEVYEENGVQIIHDYSDRGLI